MDKNIVAYVGNHSFDLILYQSRILCKLGRRVLLADYSERKALSCYFPSIPGIDTDTDCITYRSVDFTTQAITQELIHQYDDVLIDFGYTLPDMDTSLFTRVVYVIDLLEFHMGRLSKTDGFHQVQDKVLVIRDMAEVNIPLEYIRAKIDKDIGKDRIFHIYRDDNDYEAGLSCYINHFIKFMNISRWMRDFLTSEIRALNKEATKQQIRRAYKKAQRGE